jgi:ParB-like chromosome segregation protein Spo0J
LKLSDVPVLVRRLTDEQAWEVQQIENLQREGLSEIEEAEGLQQMIERKIYGETWTESVKVLSEKLGKSQSHIAGRLSLIKLGAGARQALSKGELDVTIATLVASIPDPEKQAQAVEEIKGGRWNNEPMTFKEAKAYIEREFRRSLKGAPFDPADAELYAEAGSCSLCPMRMAPNVCTNTSCYEKKKELTRQALAAKYHKQGRVVVEDSKNVFPYGDSYIAHNCGYVKASDTCHDDPRGRSYKELLAKHALPAIAFTKDGQAVEVYPSKGLNDCIRGAGHKFLEEKKEKRKEELAEEKLEKAVSLEIAKDILRVVESEDEPEKATDATLRYLLAEKLEDYSTSMRMKRVFARRGEPEVETDELWLEKLTPAAVRGYLVELQLMGYDGDFGAATEVAPMFEVQAHIVRDRVKVRIAAEANADAKKNEKPLKLKHPERGMSPAEYRRWQKENP